MTKAKAKEDIVELEPGEIDADELSNLLGENEIHPGTGVLLDTSDPNYEQLKRIEDLKAEAQAALSAAQSEGIAFDADVTKARLDAEEARLRASLRHAQNAAKAAVGGGAAASVLDTLAEQQAAAEAAAKSEGNN